MIDEVNNIKPIFDSIQKTSGEFQSSDITYNESTITYNSSSTNYGGADTAVDPAPMFESVTTSITHMDIVTGLSSTPGTVTLQAGQPMGPGFFLYITYPVTINITI